MTNTNLPQSQKSIKICSVEGCETPRKKREFCSKHYRRLLKYGDVHTVLRVNTGPLAERFWKKVPVADSSECWDWQGTILSHGYGVIVFNRKPYAAHRLSFFLSTGRWPKDWVLHSCDNKRCVNPGHLHEGTVQDNVREAHERGLSPKGSRIAASKLLEGDVLDIRQMFLDGKNDCEIGRTYAVTAGCIWRIRHNKNWRHIQL